MTEITAKIVCTSRVDTGITDPATHQAVVSFAPDYSDARNKAWSRYTPALSLTMTLTGEVANAFLPGHQYVLTFTPEP